MIPNARITRQARTVPSVRHQRPGNNSQLTAQQVGEVGDLRAGGLRFAPSRARVQSAELVMKFRGAEVGMNRCSARSCAPTGRPKKAPRCGAALPPRSLATNITRAPGRVMLINTAARHTSPGTNYTPPPRQLAALFAAFSRNRLHKKCGQRTRQCRITNLYFDLFLMT